MSWPIRVVTASLLLTTFAFAEEGTPLSAPEQQTSTVNLPKTSEEPSTAPSDLAGSQGETSTRSTPSQGLSVQNETKVSDPDPIPPPPKKVPASLIKLGQGTFYSPYAFVLDKSARTLSVWQQDSDSIQFVGAWPSDFGKKPGDKYYDGDLRTPEGVYFFEQKLERNQLDFNEYGLLAFTMDYPNFFDKRERKTGSGIWLHAIPETKTLQRGSRGCVVVRNEVILKLGEYIRLNRTPIVVEEQVNWVDPSLGLTTRQSTLEWLRDWQTHWQGKQLDAYLDMYHKDFRSQGMNKETWGRFKKGLNKKYEYIQVGVKKPTIYRHKDEWVVRFIQDYQSDQKSDLGEKYLYLKEEEGRLGIIGEVWKKISNDKDIVAQFE